MDLYKETTDEKNQRIGCMDSLMKSVMDKIHDLNQKKVKYRLVTVGDDYDFKVIMVVDNPGNSGITAGLYAISIKGIITLKPRTFRKWIKDKTLTLYIAIDQNCLPNVSLENIKDAFKECEKTFKKCLAANLHLKGIKIIRKFGEME